MIEPVLADDAWIADVETFVGSETPMLWWLGQSGFLLRSATDFLLVDPYLSDSLTAKYARTDKPHVRMTKRVVDPARLEFVTVITGSHAHTDHLDAETLRAVDAAGGEDLLMVAPRAHATLASERLGRHVDVLLDDNECWSRDDYLEIHPVPAAHEWLERDGRGRSLYLGYVLRLGAWTVYHSGDTMLYDGMADRLRPFNIDVALLPINGRAPERRVAGNMNGREAAWLAKEIGAKLVIPCHYEMFEFNTADPRDEFVPECERLGQPYKVLRAGERWSMP